MAPHRSRPSFPSQLRSTLSPAGSPPAAEPSALRRGLADELTCPSIVQDLVARAGSIEALELLDDDPLPSEPFVTSHLSDSDRAVVEAILATIDGKLTWLLDTEYQTIIRRLLARIVALHPEALRRGSVVRVAAGLVWLTLHGNGELRGGRHRHRLTADEVWFEFKVSSCADRGRALFVAAGFPKPERGSRRSIRSEAAEWLADPTLLHSSTRRNLIDLRTAAIEWVERVERQRESAKVVRRGPDGIHARARHVRPRLAFPGKVDGTNRSMIVVLCGADTDEQALALTVPDARLLVQMLNVALALPHHRVTQ